MNKIACTDCEVCYGKGGRWDDEATDQWYWCDNCDAGVDYVKQLREQAIARLKKVSAAVKALENKGTKTFDRDSNLKLYIAVLDSVPDNIVPTLVAHSVLWAYLEFESNKSYTEWLTTSFKKCVVSVSAKEFELISKLPDVSIGYELKTLEGADSCIVVCPRVDVPKVLKYCKLWKPK